jgi:hypothetical protein
MSEINEQLNSLFDSMSDDEEEVLSEELGIPLEKPAPKPQPVRTTNKRTFSRKVEKRPTPKRQLKTLNENVTPISPDNHINELAEGLGKYIHSEDIKTRRQYDTLSDLTEEERRDRKIQLLENEVTKIAQMTRAHFPGEGGLDMVSGIGQGGDGQTPGSGAVWLWDLDDVDFGAPLNGQYPYVGNGDALLFDSTTKTWKPGSPGGTYTLPVATDTILGGIKTGTSFDTDGTGVLSLSTAVTLPGNMVPANDNTQSLGSDTKYFQYVYGNGLVQRDTANNDKVILTIRNNQIILTDVTQEITTSVDLGGTIPDPGSLENVYLDGTGRYSVGVAGTAGLNTNGLVTQEFINSPGQFFVINDIDGGVFGPGDRQAFGLIRETLYDGTDLDGGPALWAGGSSGGWSMGPTWFYTGGNPYIWTFYGNTAQTPGGAGEALTGTFGSQTNQRKWWGLCTKAQVGKRIRLGIANGDASDPTGANWSNRLILQLYVSTEMLAHADASSDLPAACITNGAGYYTAFATAGEYENMGSFPDGVDKGYRFRWSTFGRTTLSQLPYVTGVSTNDQIASATGLSYYVVYDPTAADVTAANTVLATGTTSANNVFFPSVDVKILQFNDPYLNFTTPAERIYDLKYTETGAVQQSPMFHTYPISTEDEIIESALNAAGIQKLRREVCNEILDAVTGYYLILDLSTADRATASAYWSDILTVALAGQLQSVYDMTLAKSPTALAPQILLDAVTNTAKKWINTFPVAGSGNTLTFL